MRTYACAPTPADQRHRWPGCDLIKGFGRPVPFAELRRRDEHDPLRENLPGNQGSVAQRSDADRHVELLANQIDQSIAEVDRNIELREAPAELGNRRCQALVAERRDAGDAQPTFRSFVTLADYCAARPRRRPSWLR